MSGSDFIDQVMGERDRRPVAPREHRERDRRNIIISGNAERELDFLSDTRPLMSVLDSLVGGLGERGRRLGRASARNV